MPTQQQEIEFSDLLKRNIKIINSICLRYCGDDFFYFDELRQECTLALWTEFSQYGLSRFRGESKESTWIFQISFHAIVDYIRNPKHRELLSVRDQYIMENLRSNEPQSEELWREVHDDWKQLDELIEHLDNRERIMLDHYLSNDSYSTIASSEGITESNARKRMTRLINKLKMLIHK